MKSNVIQVPIQTDDKIRHTQAVSKTSDLGRKLQASYRAQRPKGEVTTEDVAKWLRKRFGS